MASGSSPDDILAASYKYGSIFKTPTEHNAKMKAFLFGYPIRHSLAPLLHRHLFRGVGIPWTFSLLETTDTSKFLPTLKQADIIGCAVTMPFKVTMLSTVDDLTEEARMVGAINTIFLRRAEDGKIRYIGTNTDTIGVREAFLQNYPQLPAQSFGRPALVIGGGGACRAAVYALSKWMGVSKIYMVNRVESEVRGIMSSFEIVGLDIEFIFVSSTAEAAALEAPALIVGTVPDIVPKEKGEILAREIVDVFLAKEDKGFVLEMCYHPNPRTYFFNRCEEMGWNVLFGTEAMIWQGVAQQSLWTELPMHQFKLDEAKRDITDAIEMKNDVM
jgi:quinate dehydrogenase